MPAIPHSTSIAKNLFNRKNEIPGSAGNERLLAREGQVRKVNEEQTVSSKIKEVFRSSWLAKILSKAEPPLPVVEGSQPDSHSGSIIEVETYDSESVFESVKTIDSISEDLEVLVLNILKEKKYTSDIERGIDKALMYDFFCQWELSLIHELYHLLPDIEPQGSGFDVFEACLAQKNRLSPEEVLESMTGAAMLKVNVCRDESLNSDAMAMKDHFVDVIRGSDSHDESYADGSHVDESKKDKRVIYKVCTSLLSAKNELNECKVFADSLQSKKAIIMDFFNPVKLKRLFKKRSSEKTPVPDTGNVNLYPLITNLLNRKKEIANGQGVPVQRKVDFALTEKLLNQSLIHIEVNLRETFPGVPDSILNDLLINATNSTAEFFNYHQPDSALSEWKNKVKNAELNVKLAETRFDECKTALNKTIEKMLPDNSEQAEALKAMLIEEPVLKDALSF